MQRDENRLKARLVPQTLEHGANMQRPPFSETTDSPPDQPQVERQLVFTSSQAARYLGVSLATIRRWADAGYINCYRTPGSQRRFSRRQLDEFISSLETEGHHARRVA
jgi:excisionase family DNA binding protein